MQERVPSDHAGTEQSKDATAVMNIDSANLSPIHVFSLVLSFCPDFQGVETAVNVLVALPVCSTPPMTPTPSADIAAIIKETPVRMTSNTSSFAP